jgi:hypothetical protein
MNVGFSPLLSFLRKLTVSFVLACGWQLTGFYRGATFPMFTVGLINCFMFTTYRFAVGELRDVPGKAMLGGTLAGWASTLLVTPIEQVRQTGQSVDLCRRSVH